MGVAAAIGILVLYGALATVPVAGRTGDEWLPVAVCWGARRSRPGRVGRMGALPRSPPAACRLARHGGGARSRRTHTHRGPLAARQQLRAARRRRAGPPGRLMGLGPGVVRARRLARAPGAVGRLVLPGRRGGRPCVSRRRGRPGGGLRVHGVVRRAAHRHGLAHLRARRRAGRAGPAGPVRRGGLRRAGPRGRDAGPPPLRCRRASRVRPQRRRPGTPAAADLRAPGRRRRSPPPGTGPLADGHGGAVVVGARRRHGARHVLGGRVAARSRCAATSWPRSSWARPARRSRW